MKVYKMLRKIFQLYGTTFYKRRWLCSAVNDKANEDVTVKKTQEIQTAPDFFQRVLKRFPPGSTKNDGFMFPLAFAYGSGVFRQEGNVSRDNMTDFILTVENSEMWHAANIARNPSDYSGLMSIMGPRVISELQDSFGAKSYFNTLVPFEDGLIKYGVLNRSNLIADLLDWESLYVAGRLQKPVRIIDRSSKEIDPELSMALRMNLKNALHTSFLLLPEKFSEQKLYETICGLSYTGDFRMHVGGEDKNKVQRIAEGSITELRQLYAKQMSKMSEFVYAKTAIDASDDGEAAETVIYEQDLSPGARHFHLSMLPKNMQELLVRTWNQDGKWRDVEDVLRSAAYDRDVDDLIRNCLGYVVARPAAVQAAKGIVSAGLSKTFVYSSKKVSKMLKSKG